MCSWRLNSVFSLNLIAVCLLIILLSIRKFWKLKSWKQRENAEVLQAFVYEAHVWKLERLSLLLLLLHTNLNSANWLFCSCICVCVYLSAYMCIFLIKHLFWMLSVFFILHLYFFIPSHAEIMNDTQNLNDREL